MIKYVTKLWGSEEWLVNNEIYCAKYLNLCKGYQCSLHYHKIKDETFYILDGEVELEVSVLPDGEGYSLETRKLSKGDQIRIAPGTIHRFRSVTPTSKILEVSTTHFDNDSYRIEESKKI